MSNPPLNCNKLLAPVLSCEVDSNVVIFEGFSWGFFWHCVVSGSQFHWIHSLSCVMTGKITALFSIFPLYYFVCFNHLSSNHPFSETRGPHLYAIFSLAIAVCPWTHPVSGSSGIQAGLQAVNKVMILFDEGIQGGNECENIIISSWKIREQKNGWINE